ncbi:MAG: DNA polymerase III subunit delta' [Filomicrobium sp.]
MARAPATQEIEPDPESDVLEGFPHPRATSQLFGHRTAQTEFASGIAKNKIHHAWLMTGPPGIGKATLAYKFAKCLLATSDERQVHNGRLEVPQGSQANRQVEALSHPGLLVLRRPYERKTKRFLSAIPVDEVRRLRSFLSHRASDAAWRVVVVDTADDLNVNAANALLKSLEEPPERLVFLLLSSEPGRLLKTIRSRCRSLDLDALSPEDLQQAAHQAFATSGQQEPSEKAYQTLVSLSQGSVRRLASLHFAGGLDLNKKIIDVLSAIPSTPWSKVHQLAEQLGPAAAEEKYTLYHQLLFDFLAKIVRKAALGDATGSDGEIAARLIKPHQLASWAALWETLAREEAETRALNLDRKAFILGTIQRIEATAKA